MGKKGREAERVRLGGTSGVLAVTCYRMPCALCSQGFCICDPNTNTMGVEGEQGKGKQGAGGKPECYTWCDTSFSELKSGAELALVRGGLCIRSESVIFDQSCQQRTPESKDCGARSYEAAED